MQVILADSRKVTSLEFFDAVFGSSDAIRAERRRQSIENCIRAIERGDTYGIPPVLVAECRKIIAERRIERDFRSEVTL